jgi:hypothetical protein
MSVPARPENGAAGLDREAIEDLLDVLNDVPQWTLAPNRWERVAHILETIVAAVAAADLAALLNAITELELAGPVRVGPRIGAREVVSVPEPIKDRVNHLVHALRAGNDRPRNGQPDPSNAPGETRDAR